MYIGCFGMIRSGSTLQYNIVAEIIELKNIGQRLGWLEYKDFINDNKKDSKISIFKNHTLLNEIEEFLFLNKGICFYTYRDIRDVCVSFMKKENKTFQEVFNSRILHNAIEEFYKIKNTRINKYVQSYETMFNDTKNEIKNIADFLDITLSSEEINEIYQSVSIDKQKENIQLYKKEKNYIESNNLKYNSHTLIHLNHIDDGMINKYKNILSDEELMLLEKEFSEWLEKQNYNFIKQVE